MRAGLPAEQVRSMTIKEILSKYITDASQRLSSDLSKSVTQPHEKLLIRLNRCFVETILPAVFEVENDLNEIGCWNQVDIGQSTSMESGKPNIKDVTLYFYPEKSEQLPARHRTIDTTYRAIISTSRDFRKISFTYHIPKRIPKTVESENNIYTVDQIDTTVVDAFLENFIRGAMDAYNSDRMLR